MGAPSDDDADRVSAPQREIPVDEAWSKGTPAHNDQTSAGLVVDSATLGRLTSGLGRDRFAISSEQVRTATLDADAATTAKPDAVAAAATPDLDRTTIDAGVTPYGRAPTEDSTVSAIDQTMAELERSDVPEPLRLLAESQRSNAAGEVARTNGVAKHDRTRAGLGVAAPARPAKFALLDPSKGTIPLEKPHALLQPERSPLDFVMRDMDPAAPTKPQSSGDSSRFVAAIMDGQPPPRIDADSPATTAMQPVLRRSRLRRKWIAAGAFAATAVLGTAFAMTLTSAESRPKAAASEVAKVTEDQAPVAATAAAPTPSEVVTPTVPPEPSPVAAPAVAAAEPTVAEAPTAAAPPVTQHVVAATATSETAAPAKTVSPSAKPAIANKTVATKDVTDKKSSTTKTASPAKKTVATKDATAKKSTTTKKASPDKKKVATKDATAKKSATTKKASPDKKKVATKDAKAKKPSTTKKSSPEKKPTAKKTATKKASRAQHRPRRSRPD
jgi:DNA-binding protein HU-beta